MKKCLPSAETTDSRNTPFELRATFGFHRFKAALADKAAMADGSNSDVKADRGGAEGGAEYVDCFKRCFARSAISSRIFLSIETLQRTKK